MRPSLKAEDAFRQLADGLAQGASDDFFGDLARLLARILQVDHVLVAEVQPPGHQARTLAVWSAGRPQDNFTYVLAGTPCERVIGQEPCFYSRDVCAQFPDDAILDRLRVQGYLGIPMFAPDGRSMGLVAVLHDRPLILPDLGREVLRIAAARAGAELARQQAERAVRESERRLATLMSHLPGMAYQCLDDDPRTMLFVSQGATALTGHGVADLTDNRRVSYQALIHPADRERVGAEMRARVAQREPYRLTYRLRTASGDTRWVWEHGQAVCDEHQRVIRLEGLITDVTKQQESQRVQQAVLQIATAVTARSGEAFFDQLVHHLTLALQADAGFIATLDEAEAPDSLMTLAAVVDGRKVDNFSYTVQATPCERVMQERECVVADRVAGRLPEACQDALGWAKGYVGRRLDDAAGEPVGLLTVLFREPLEDVEFTTSVMQIFAAGAAAELERQQSDRRIRRLAYWDTATGLPNRAHFMERLTTGLHQASEEGGSLGLLLLDLRRFEEINDIHGHEVGDRVLAEAGLRFAGVTRQREFLARLGGDEFAVLIEGVDPAALVEDVARFQAALTPPVEVQGRDFPLEVSIGSACYPHHAHSPGELFQQVSIAMYHAKRREGGCCQFDTELGEALSRRQLLTEGFIEALRGERLALHYQPQFDLQSGALTGAEALCRWHDERWGWVSPGEFIPLAEERGLMKELGDWVLRAVCRQLLAWQVQGLPLPGRLSINVSAQQLDDQRLVEEVRRHSAGLEPTRIGLELTESGFMRDPEQAVRITQALKAAGFGLSIDDFGTGYSSLAYLKRFSADTLKIDMSFVHDMLDEGHDRAIVTTIIAMARSLGMMTIAEGVETTEQAAALAALGCDRAQGFYLGRPVAADDFAACWLVPATLDAEPGA